MASGSVIGFARFLGASFLEELKEEPTFLIPNFYLHLPCELFIYPERERERERGKKNSKETSNFFRI